MTTKPDFILFPAIDLRHGRVVRLAEGDPNRQSDYDPDPAAAARRWLDCGATWLHVVSLDAAFGEAGGLNRAALERILAAAAPYGARIQFGGGLRSLEAVEEALGMGVARAVLGTLAAENPAALAEALARWGTGRIAAGIDGREGRVRVRGWREAAPLRAADLARQLWEGGLEWLIFTDIARDGLQQGVNLDATLELAAACRRDPETPAVSAHPIRLVASGGVRGPEDVRAALQAGLAGIIVGRALYEGKLDLKQMLKEV